jgi:hypothetical protein|tara:strand:- start:1549 stop:2184 length:636 start_codon:yes stop_codon:yes gene_type:complete
MKTRESFLIRATTILRQEYIKHGYDLPELHVSIGFPSKRATAHRNRCIGECWHGEGQKGGKAHLFISPVLDGPGALETLVHEHVHAFLPAGVGHGPAFKRAMGKVGLTGKPTATEAGKALKARLLKLEEKLGGYPHDTLNLNAGKKKQTTRLIKVECADCDYVARVTRKPLDAFGPPICPGCNESMVEAGKEVQHPTLSLSLKYATSTARN